MCVCVCAAVTEAALNEHVREREANTLWEKSSKELRETVGLVLQRLKETPESLALPSREAN